MHLWRLQLYMRPCPLRLAAMLLNPQNVKHFEMRHYAAWELFPDLLKKKKKKESLLHNYKLNKYYLKKLYKWSYLRGCAWLYVGVCVLLGPFPLGHKKFMHGISNSHLAGVNVGHLLRHLRNVTVIQSIYRKTSSISRTESQNVNVSCIPLQLSSLNLLKPRIKLRMKM